VGSASEVAAAGVVLPYFAVTAIAEVPYGAHPTSCYPHYTYDRAHMGEWVQAAASARGVGQYLDRYVLESEEAYQKEVGTDRLVALGEWSASDERWLELLS